jgi:hypothetical protein
MANKDSHFAYLKDIKFRCWADLKIIDRTDPARRSLLGSGRRGLPCELSMTFSILLLGKLAGLESLLRRRTSKQRLSAPLSGLVQ